MNPSICFPPSQCYCQIVSGAANAGETINEAGALACINDKWDEKELDKGHKLVEYAGRCVKLG